MNKNFNIIKIVLFLFSVGVESYSYYGIIRDVKVFGDMEPETGMFIGYWIVVFVVAWQFWEMSKEISSLKNRKPRIVFGEPKCIEISQKINDYGVNSFIEKQISPSTDFYLFCIDFINSPQEKENSDALGVQAFLEFYDENDDKQYSYFGRWIEMPERKLNEKHRYTDIPSDGRTSSRLGIMYISGKGGNEAYLLDSDTVDNAPEGMVLNPPFLSKGKYTLVVNISGRNFQEVSRIYDIQNLKGERLIFSEKKNADKWIRKIEDDKKELAKLWNSL